MEVKDFELELFPDSKKVTVSGPIGSLFHGLNCDGDVKKKVYESMVGLPLKNHRTDDVIGEITSVDLENDRWYGILY